MKATKKTISLIMCILIVMSTLSLAASAADKAVFDIKCEKLDGLVTDSVPLKVEDFTLPAGFKVTDVKFYDIEKEAFLSPTDKLMGGKTYKIALVFGKTNGTAITQIQLNGTQIMLNGKKVNAVLVSGKVGVNFNITVSNKYISALYISTEGYGPDKSLSGFTVSDNITGTELKDVSVWDKKAKRYLTSDDKFEEGKEYVLYVDYYLKDGYYLTENFRVESMMLIDVPYEKKELYFKGEDEKGRYIVFRFELKPPAYADSVEITFDGYNYAEEVGDITVTENSPDAEFYCGAVYYKGGYCILVDDADGKKKALSDESTFFEYDKQYYLGVRLVAAYGSSLKRLTKMGISLKGYSCTFEFEKKSDNEVVIYFKLPELVSPNTVSEINLQLKGYEIGKDIDDLRVIADTDKIELSDNGIVNKWDIYDSTNDRPTHKQFIAGGVYRLAVCFEVKKGYSFKPDKAADIIHLPDASFIGIEKDGKYYIAKFSLPFLVKENITSVDAAVTAPIAYNSPDSNVTVTTDPSSAIEKTYVSWYECDTNSNKFTDWREMKKGDLFKENKYYLVKLGMEPAAKYQFSMTAKKKVNGADSNNSFSADDNALTWMAYGYVFGPLEKHPCSLSLVDMIKPTCETDGKKEYYHCDICGRYFEDSEGKKEISDISKWGVIKASGHNRTAIEAVEATCTSTGLTAGEKCTSCGLTLVEQKVVPKKEHSYKETITEATLTADGKKVTFCETCTYKESVTIAKISSVTLSTTKCSYNGKTRTPSVAVKDADGNMLVKDKDYTVSYESGRKLPGKYTVKITFKGNYSGTKKLYFTITAKAVSGIKANQTTDTVTLSWSKATGANGYRVYKYNSKTKKYEKLKDVKGTSLKISKLKSGTAYKYKVRAYTKDDGTIWGSYSSAFETATKCKTPAVTNLTSAKGKATLTWTNVSGESGYQIYYSTKKTGGYKKYASLKANTAKGTVSKLSSGKTYYFKVRAFKKTDSAVIYSSWSAVKSVKIK